MPQLTTYIDKRLACWAIWVRWGSSGAPQRVVSWYDKVVMAPNVQGRGGDSQPCPVNEGEAYETHKAIGALAEHLRDAVAEQWLWSGTAAMKAQRLRLQPRQFYERLHTANIKLLGYLNDIAAGTPLPAPELSHKNVKKHHNKKSLTLPHTFRTFPATVA